jgi:hypothetical protein
LRYNKDRDVLLETAEDQAFTLCGLHKSVTQRTQVRRWRGVRRAHAEACPGRCTPVASSSVRNSAAVPRRSVPSRSA